MNFFGSHFCTIRLSVLYKWNQRNKKKKHVIKLLMNPMSLVANVFVSFGSSISVIQLQFKTAYGHSKNSWNDHEYCRLSDARIHLKPLPPLISLWAKKTNCKEKHTNTRCSRHKVVCRSDFGNSMQRMSYRRKRKYNHGNSFWTMQYWTHNNNNYNNMMTQAQCLNMRFRLVFTKDDSKHLQ